MFRIMRKRTACTVLATWLVAAAGLAHAGLPQVIVFGTPTTSSLTSPGQFQTGPIKTVTLNLNNNGNTAYGASLVSLGLTGADAADFAIAPGGTCAAGTTFLYPAGATCTVNVSFTPSRPGSESAQLTASCNTIVGAIGGFIVVCNGTVGTVAALLGSLVAAATAVPALSPGMLTALAIALFALASFAALRRTPVAPRRR